MALTESEEQQLKSGLYNANSALQYLRSQVSGLELTVNQQNATIFGLTENIQTLNHRLEHLEDNAILRS